MAALLVVALAALATPLRAHPGHGCVESRAARWRAATGVADAAGDVRVYAIQFKHEIRHVETYASFHEKMRCLVLELVMPTADADRNGKADRPTIVAFNEDAGLATVATGTRGAPARALATFGPKNPETIEGAQNAFASLAVTHAPAVAYYSQREPDTSPPRLILAAATDTFVRGFMKTNSDLAREFGIYVVSSNNQAEFRETADAGAIAALRDPDTPLAATVFEAVDVDEIAEWVGVGRAGIDVYNQAWMWSPHDAPASSPVRQRYEQINGGPLSSNDPRRNIVMVNKKTPITSIEHNVLDLSDDRDMRPSNTGPFTLPDVPGARIGFGISLPSFMWGTDFGVPFTGAPCASPTTWMRCLDARGVNLFLQPEANPGSWADYIDVSWTPTAFQSLSWLDSAWRAVADPTVTNIRYAVTPHLVGNLVDLTFDGQSVIFERCDVGGIDRCAGNTAQAFVGARTFLPCPAPGATRCDDPDLEPYAGLLRETIALAPWVVADCCDDATANREFLAKRARDMLPASGTRYENDYLETAVWADLDLD